MNPNPDFTIPRGDTPTMNISINNLWTVSGAPFTLTFSAKGDLNARTPYAIQWSISGINATVSGVAQLLYQFTTEETDINPGTYNYDFKLVNSSGQLVMHTPASLMEIGDTVTL